MLPEERKFTTFIRRSGLKMTRTRREILKEVFESHDHFDAEDLYFRLKEKDAGVSRATVYRTLNLLVSSGLVRKMELGEGRSIYEHVLGHHHHDHMICLHCNKIIEFHNPEIEQLQQKVCDQREFKLISHSQELYGLCKECQKTASP